MLCFVIIDWGEIVICKFILFFLCIILLCNELVKMLVMLILINLLIMFGVFLKFIILLFLVCFESFIGFFFDGFFINICCFVFIMWWVIFNVC